MEVAQRNDTIFTYLLQARCSSASAVTTSATTAIASRSIHQPPSSSFPRSSENHMFRNLEQSGALFGYTGFPANRSYYYSHVVNSLREVEINIDAELDEHFEPGLSNFTYWCSNISDTFHDVVQDDGKTRIYVYFLRRLHT